MLQLVADPKRDRPAFAQLYADRKGTRTWASIATRAGVSTDAIQTWLSGRHRMPLVEGYPGSKISVLCRGAIRKCSSCGIGSNR